MGLALATAALAGVLFHPVGVAAAGPIGDLRALVPQARLLVPAHDTGANDLDRAGAIKTARHIVEDLSAEGRIDAGWKDAAMAEVRNRRVSAFRLWVVHFKSAAELDGQGSDLFIFMNQKGTFLKYSYDGR